MLLLSLLLVFWPQRMIERYTFSSVDAAPRQYQPRDLTTAPMGTYYIFIGENQYYCVVTAQQYASIDRGDLFDCRWEPPKR